MAPHCRQALHSLLMYVNGRNSYRRSRIVNQAMNNVLVRRRRSYGGFVRGHRRLRSLGPDCGD